MESVVVQPAFTNGHNFIFILLEILLNFGVVLLSVFEDLISVAWVDAQSGKAIFVFLAKFVGIMAVLEMTTGEKKMG